MMRRHSIPTRASFDQLAHDAEAQRDLLTGSFAQLAEEVMLGCQQALHTYDGPARGSQRPACAQCGLRAAHLIHHPALLLVSVKDGAR